MRKNGQENGRSTERDVRHDNAEQQRANRRSNRNTGITADWGSADAAVVSQLICCITKHGYAVRFGYTRDGGSFALGIMGDGEPFTEFCRPTEDINLFLAGFVEDYK
jgi:hypothetical protein